LDIVGELAVELAVFDLDTGDLAFAGGLVGKQIDIDLPEAANVVNNGGCQELRLCEAQPTVEGQMPILIRF